MTTVASIASVDPGAMGLGGGAYVSAAGYLEPGDGGAGTWQIVYGWGDSVDPFVVMLPGSYHARLVHDGDVNVRQLGARGDGAADDTMAFLAAVADPSVSRIVVPRGEYRIDLTIFIDHRGHLEIVGRPGSIIRWIDGHQFNSQPNDPTPAASWSRWRLIYVRGSSDVRITGLTLDGNRYRLTAEHLLPPEKRQFEFGGGIAVSGSTRVRVTDCVIRDTWGGGVSCIDASSDIDVERCTVVRPRQTAFVCTQATNMRVRSCTGYVCHNGFIDVEPNDNQPPADPQVAADCQFAFNTYYNDDVALRPDLRLTAGEHPPEGPAVYYTPGPVPVAGGLRAYRGTCTVLQCTAIGRARAERIVFTGNTVHQTGATKLIAAHADDVTFSDNTFHIGDPVEQRVRLGWGEVGNTRRSVLSGNRFVGRPPTDAAEAAAWRTAARSIRHFMIAQGIGELRIDGNDFAGVAGGAHLTASTSCVFVDNVWRNVEPIEAPATVPPPEREQRTFAFSTDDGDSVVLGNVIDTAGSELGLSVVASGTAHVGHTSFDGAYAPDDQLNRHSIVQAGHWVAVIGLVAPDADFSLGSSNPVWGIRNGPTDRTRVLLTSSKLGVWSDTFQHIHARR